jgi:hypothetical protein
MHATKPSRKPATKVVMLDFFVAGSAHRNAKVPSVEVPVSILAAALPPMLLVR